jgi:hypothetical protein
MTWRRMGSGCIDPGFFDLDTSWRWVVSFKLLPHYSQEKNPRLHWIGGWVKWKLLTLQGLELRYLGRSARRQSLYDWATAALRNKTAEFDKCFLKNYVAYSLRRAEKVVIEINLKLCTRASIPLSDPVRKNRGCWVYEHSTWGVGRVVSTLYIAVAPDLSWRHTDTQTPAK